MQQGHDFLRAPPAPPATTVPAAALAEFGRPNVIFDGTLWNRAFLFNQLIIYKPHFSNGCSSEVFS